jgi:hypothetical protein
MASSRRDLKRTDGGDRCRLDDLRDSVNKRFDDLCDLLKSEVKRLEDRLIRLEHQSLIKTP